MTIGQVILPLEQFISVAVGSDFVYNTMKITKLGIPAAHRKYTGFVMSWVSISNPLYVVYTIYYGYA